MSDPTKEPVGVSETPHSEGEKKEVKAWLSTISNTEKWRNQKFERMGCKRFINEYKGDWDFLQSSVSIPLIPVNLVYAFVKTDVARMSFRDPWITVNPKRIEDLGASQIAEQVINYTWQELKLKQQVKQNIVEADLVGHSWIKVGYAAEFGTVESQPKEEPKRGPGRPAKKYKEVETNEYIKSENVFAYYVPYQDVIFDPSATYPVTHNARWMAHKVVKPYRAIVQSGIYEHTDDLRVSSTTEDPNETFSNADSLKEQGGKNVRSCVLWEIYDLDHQVVTTVSPGCEYKLREIPLPDYLDGGFPFLQLAFTPVPGEPYPLSEVAPAEGLVIEHIKMKAIGLNHLKRWNRQMAFIDGCIEDEELSKFKDANDGALIRIQPIAGKSISENITPIQYAPMQSDIPMLYQQNMQEMQSVWGQTSADQGGQAKTQTRTLGELRVALQGGHARSDEKLDTLEDFIADVAKKLLTIMQKKYDLPKLTRIVGEKTVREKILKMLPARPSVQPNMPGQPPQQQPQQLPGVPGQPQAPQPQAPTMPNPVASQSYTGDFGFSWNRQDILGEMDVDVLAGSTTPMDREAQLQIMEKMFPYLGAFGITPGSPASKSYARKFMRLIGDIGLEEVMDQAEQTPPQPNPKMMEIQAKVQAKQAETKMKLQGKQQEMVMKQKEQEIKLQGAKQELAIKQAKGQAELQNNIMKTILEQFRTPQAANGNGHE